MSNTRKRLTKRAAAGAVASALVLPGLVSAAVPASAAPEFEVERLTGADRYGTAADAALTAFPDGADTVVVASGEVFPDALAGSFLAGLEAAPILLTRGNDVPDQTAAAIQDLGATNVIILGGTARISAAVQAELATLVGGAANVTRVQGANRYATAAAIAAESDETAADERVAFLATGENFADALAAGPIAYAAGIPILLTSPNGLSPETAEAIRTLDIDTIIPLGGTAALSAGVLSALPQGVTVEDRLEGANRRATAVAIAEFALANFPELFDNTGVVVANGENFPDALSASPVAGLFGFPLLLTQSPTALGAETEAYLTANEADLVQGFIAGGPAAVSTAVEAAIVEAAGGVDQPEQPAASVDLGQNPTAAAGGTISGTATGAQAVTVSGCGFAADTALTLTDGAFTTPAIPAGQAAGACELTFSITPTGGGAAVTQTVSVNVTAAPSALDVEPEFQYAQVGRDATLTATVTSDAPAGSMTRTPSAGVEVTFQVPATAGQQAQTLTATTNAEGVATATYTRNNPTSEQVTAFVTGRPELRDDVQVEFNLAAAPVTLSPDTASTQAVGTTRTYTVTRQDLGTGAAEGGAVAITAAELLDADATNNPTQAALTFAGTGGTVVTEDGADGNDVLAVVTVPAGGTASFTVSSSDARTVTPIAFRDADGAGDLDASDLRDAGGATTFVAPVVTVAVTPDTAASQAEDTTRSYEIQAQDQFGNAHTGPVVVGFNELLDNVTGTTTIATIVSTDADNDLTTGATLAPANAQSVTIASLNAQGRAVFTITAADPTSATPSAYIDANSSGTRQADEVQDNGGTTTFVAAALTSASLSGGGTTAPASATADPTVDETNRGDVVVTYTFRNQGGGAFDPAGTVPVTFTVANAGPSAVVVNSVGGAQADNVTVASGATGTVTVNATAETAAIEVDAAGAASVTVNATSTVSGTAYAAGPAGANFVAVDQTTTINTAETYTGTVVQVNKGTDTSDGGSYVLQTSVGNVLVTYGTTDTFTVDGNSATLAQFEAALTVNDGLTFSDTAANAQTHALTNRS